MVSVFSQKAVKIMKSIPAGKVCTYGRIAAAAGKERGARQVARLLHSLSHKENLSWQRVVNSKGRISLKPGDGYELQKFLLEQEGIEFDDNDRIDFNRYLWHQL